MKYLLAAILALLVLGFHGLSFILGVLGLERVLVQIGAPTLAPYIGSGFVEVSKAVLLGVGVALLLTRKLRAAALGTLALVVWAAMASLSVVATHATVQATFSAIDRTAAMSTEKREGLLAELRDAERQLALVVTSRPVDVVRAEVEALKQNRRWQLSAGCTDATATESRTFCSDYHRLFGELAGATNAEAVRARIRELRGQLAGTGITEAHDPLLDSFSAVLGWLVSAPGARGVAWLVVIATEVMSCFGMAMVVLLLERTHVVKLQKPHAERKPSREEGCNEPSGPLVEANENVRVEGSTTASCETLQAQQLRRVEGCSEPSTPTLQGAAAQPSATLLGTVQARPSARRLEVVGSHVGEFVGDCFERAEDGVVQASEIWSAYEAWCARQGVDSVTQTRLGRELVGLDIGKEKVRGVIVYRGLAPRPVARVA